MDSPLVPPSCIPRSSRFEPAHIPLERGGACVGGCPRLERAGVRGDEHGGSGRRKMNPTSTIDGVDDGFQTPLPRTMITLDLNACDPDYKKKNSMILIIY